ATGKSLALRLTEEPNQLLEEIVRSLFRDPVSAAFDDTAADVLRELLHGEQGHLAEAALAAQRQNRHLEFVARVLLVVLKVGEDGAIVFEPGAQPARRRVTAYVLVNVFFADGGGVVRGAVEPGEVRPLAPVDQRFRKVAHVVKLDVPDAAVRTKRKRLLQSGAGNTDVEDHQLAHVIGMRARVRIRHRPAPIVPDQKDTLEAELAYQLVDVVSHVA